MSGFKRLLSFNAFVSWRETNLYVWILYSDEKTRLVCVCCLKPLEVLYHDKRKPKIFDIPMDVSNAIRVKDKNYCVATRIDLILAALNTHFSLK
jgi:hypothetical protein